MSTVPSFGAVGFVVTDGMMDRMQNELELVTVEIDERGRTSLGRGRVKPGKYAVTVEPDGSVLLQPGRFVTEQQMQLMARPDILQAIALGESRPAVAQARRPHPRRSE